MLNDEDEYRESAKAALDSAITEVAREEYARLINEISLIAMPRITDALRQLDKLQNGVMPNYNQWGRPILC